MSGTSNAEMAWPVGQAAFGPTFVRGQQAAADQRFGRAAEGAGTQEMLVNMELGQAAQQAERGP